MLDVALPIPVPQTFHYLPAADGTEPDGDWIGCRVRVPFGRGEHVGVVVDLADAAADALKPIVARLDEAPLFEPPLWRALRWAAGYYHHPLGEVIAAATPAVLRRGEPLPTLAEPALALTADGRSALADTALRPGPGRAVLELLAPGPLPVAAIRERLGDPGRAAAARLRRRGWVADCLIEARTLPLPVLPGPPPGPAQREAIDDIGVALGAGYRAFLLDGVTGSGKTEVYLAVIERALAQQRQALVLVPEIALTPQALKRFRERLAAPVLAVHSGLSDGERARAFAFARSGRPCVVLGTRSAVFAPLPNGGLIVVDEEHDGSYKQADGFRYHARDLALVRAKTMAVPVVLGSATPSLETLALTEDGRVTRRVLPDRATGARPPAVGLVDVRAQKLSGGLSTAALAAIGETLARGEQALVFRNRRGYAPLLACNACGWHALCPRCDRALTLHRELNLLLCHHCGARQRPPARCPDCASAPLDTRGIGTERIEAELALRFPQHRVLRIDRDSVRSAARLDAALADVAEGEPAILVGTQLLAKGHDWPALTRVVIADADSGLFSADFRAPERLAQLLTQVAGRAGRGARAGSVLVQTRQPQHPFWSRWLTGGYAAIAQSELEQRREGQLPPFRHQALLSAEARATAALDEFFAAALTLPQAHSTQVERLGPLPAPMPRRAGYHRAQILLDAEQRAPLHALLDAWLPAIHRLRQARRVRWHLDVDPYDF